MRFNVLVAAILALPLGGCVAGVVASGVSAAASGMRRPPQSNAELRPEALRACSARAAAYGTPHIIDSEQRSIAKIVVWGIIDDGRETRAFECSFGRAVTGFRLRAVRPKYPARAPAGG